MIIGIGTDIIEIQRIQRAVNETNLFLSKIYTTEEQAIFKERGNRVESLAGLFAAKEAVSKALGTGFRSFSPNEIEILPNDLGKPEVCLLGRAKVLGEKLGVKRIHMTISHCQTYAVAYAIVEGDES